MTNDPSKIQLTEEQKELLASYANALGMSWNEAFELAMSGTQLDPAWLKAQQETLRQVWDNDKDSVYDEL